MVKRANATVSNISTANLSLLLPVEECLKLVNILPKFIRNITGCSIPPVRLALSCLKMQISWDNLCLTAELRETDDNMCKEVLCFQKFRNTFASKKVQGAHTQIPSIGFQSWSQFLAVSLQVTWVINPVGRHYFPPVVLYKTELA